MYEDLAAQTAGAANGRPESEAGREAYDEKATVRNSKSSFKKLTIWVIYNFVGMGKTDPMRACIIQTSKENQEIGPTLKGLIQGGAGDRAGEIKRKRAQGECLGIRSR